MGKKKTNKLVAKIEEEIEASREYIRERENLIPLAEKIPDELKFCVLSGGLIVRIKSLPELTRMRKILRGIFGKWNDRRTSTWHSCGGKMIVEWKSENPPISIWLECDPENFPEKLQSGKCKIVKKKYVQTNYYYVCEV